MRRAGSARFQGGRKGSLKAPLSTIGKSRKPKKKGGRALNKERGAINHRQRQVGKFSKRGTREATSGKGGLIFPSSQEVRHAKGKRTILYPKAEKENRLDLCWEEGHQKATLPKKKLLRQPSKGRDTLQRRGKLKTGECCFKQGDLTLSRHGILRGSSTGGRVGRVQWAKGTGIPTVHSERKGKDLHPEGNLSSRRKTRKGRTRRNEFGGKKACRPSDPERELFPDREGHIERGGPRKGGGNL